MPVAGSRHLIVLVAVAAVCATTAAMPASAGTFDVTSCSANSAASPPTPAGGADDAWVFVTDDPAHLESVDHCAPTDDSGIDGLVAQTRLNSGGPAVGRSAEWRFDAAPGTAITRLRRWGYIGKQLNDWELYTRTADGTKLPGSDCTVGVNDFTCMLDSAPDWTFVATSAVHVGMKCANAINTCATGATLHEAWSSMYRTVVTVQDNVAPTAASAGGSLLTDGYLHGTLQATLNSASDNTGIRAVQVRVDGAPTPVGQIQRACDFTTQAPCTNLTSPASVSVDTTKIPDGTHTVAVGAVDPAENFTAATSRQVTVDNTPPVTPTATSPQQQSLSTRSATVTWANPPGQIAPVTVAHVTVCAPSGCSTRTQAVSGDGGSTTVALTEAGFYNVGVALEDAAGNYTPYETTGWSISYRPPSPAPTSPAPSPAPTVTPSPTPAATPMPVPAPAPQVLASPRLALARPTVARDRRTITVRGTVAAGTTGKVTVKASVRIRGHTRTVTRSATIQSRRYSVRLRLRSSAWRTAKVTVRYAGSVTRKAATVTRTVHQHGH